MKTAYNNNKEKNIRYLTNWVDTSIKSESWTRHDDLHIDEIDTIFNNSEIWVDASLFLFHLLLEIVENKEYTVLLAMPLSYAEKKTDIDKLTLEYIRTQMDLTPPSFYLDPINSINYKETIESTTPVKKLSESFALNVGYSEEPDEEGAYFRWLCITK